MRQAMHVLLYLRATLALNVVVVRGARDGATAAADIVECHARVGRPLLALEEDSLVLAALCALLLDAR